MQMCDFFMKDLIDFINEDFMTYIKNKREHQMRKLIKKCYEREEKYGMVTMVNF